MPEDTKLAPEELARLGAPDVEEAAGDAAVNETGEEDKLSEITGDVASVPRVPASPEDSLLGMNEETFLLGDTGEPSLSKEGGSQVVAAPEPGPETNSDAVSDQDEDDENADEDVDDSAASQQTGTNQGGQQGGIPVQPVQQPVQHGGQPPAGPPQVGGQQAAGGQPAANQPAPPAPPVPPVPPVPPAGQPPA